MVQKARIFTGLLLGVASSAMAAPVISTQTLLDSAQIAQPAYFNYWYSSSQLNSSTSIDVSFQDIWASFGRKTTTPWDWSGANGIAFRVTNLESYDFQLGMRLNAGGSTIGPKFYLPAGQTRDVVIEFNPINTAGQYGFMFSPPLMYTPHVRIRQGQGMDWAHVYEWALFDCDSTPRHVRLENVRLLSMQNDMSSLVDQWGQYSMTSWSGKVGTAQDLIAQRDAETQDLNAAPVTGEPFGTSMLPAQTATGRWRTVQLPSGKWYLVTPTGKLFWSYGLNSIKYGHFTKLTGRESMFQNVPALTSTTQDFYCTSGTDRLFNFTTWAMQAKYGSNWKNTFLSRTQARMSSWGMNTIGGFPDGGVVESIAMPFTLTLDTNSYGTRLNVPFRIWNNPPDPFGSDFQSWCDSNFAATLGKYVGNTRLLGAFVDNEISWSPWDTSADANRYQIAIAAIKSPGAQPAKKAFVAQLQAKYNTIGAFDYAWGVGYADWNSLLLSTKIVPQYTTSSRADMAQFVQSFAATYYGKVKAALQSAGLAGLYLGSRDASWTPETRAAADAYVDVYSQNIYKQANQIDWTFPGITKPVVISEFNFGAVDRGGFGTAVDVLTQGDRAAALKQYTFAAINDPRVVGAHWYQYFDQPTTGRASDGENFNNGMCSATDSPYPEMVAASRTVGGNIYGTRGQ